jgi:transcription termination factor Rho
MGSGSLRARFQFKLDKTAGATRKQELMFAILKQLAIAETDIVGEGVVGVLSDGFGFLRSPDANYFHQRCPAMP